MSEEHPVQQAIRHVQVRCDENGNPIDYIVGKSCSRIEACTKPGEYCFIPYVRVWRGDQCLGEFNQHSLNGVWFEVTP